MEISDTEESIYLSVVLGMWFHTREIVGKPTRAEAEISLASLPTAMRDDVIDMLGSLNQLAMPDLRLLTPPPVCDCEIGRCNGPAGVRCLISGFTVQ